MVNLVTGEVAPGALRVACKDRRQAICPSCSYLYKADAWVLVSAGLVGGKGVDGGVGTHPRLFVTLTAPSFGAVHTVTSRGECVTRGDNLSCRHGLSARCSDRHRVDDPVLGRPLCQECFEYVGAILWNAHASRLWNVTVLQIRRRLAKEVGVTQTALRSRVQFHYLKVAEVQRRGLVHFHAIVRVDGPDEVQSEPPPGLTSDRLAKVVRRAVRESSVTGLDGNQRRWGRILDIRDLAKDPVDARKVSSYVAKYAVKTTDGSRALARPFRSRRHVEMLVDDPHFCRLVLTAWDLAERPDLEMLHLRDHAHTLGFPGHLITKSRSYSTTFQALRSARATYMAEHREGDPVEGSFRYDGRGYDDPRGTELAELFFRMQRELREESATARRQFSQEPQESPYDSL
jgi:hypothetical protein